MPILYDALFLGFLAHKAYWEELEMYSTLTSIALIKSFKTEETRGLYLYLLMSYAYLYDARFLEDSQVFQKREHCTNRWRGRVVSVTACWSEQGYAVW